MCSAAKLIGSQSRVVGFSSRQSVQFCLGPLCCAAEICLDCVVFNDVTVVAALRGIMSQPSFQLSLQILQCQSQVVGRAEILIKILREVRFARTIFSPT